jgi:uncharacterized protein (TIGR02246 family)
MPNDEQAIRDLITKWQEFTAIGDLDSLLKLMDEDVVFLVTGQPPMRGRDAFAAGFQKAVARFQIDSTSEIQEIRVTGDWAYCWNHLSVTMTPRESGSPVRRTGYTLTIFRKGVDSNWVLFRDANLLAVESGAGE